jgi:hypothetical protein
MFPLEEAGKPSSHTFSGQSSKGAYLTKHPLPCKMSGSNNRKMGDFPMSQLSKKILFCVSLIILSSLIYLLDYLIFRNARDLIFYTLMDIAFMFIQVLLVTIIIQELLVIKMQLSRLILSPI